MHGHVSVCVRPIGGCFQNSAAVSGSGHREKEKEREKEREKKVGLKEKKTVQGRKKASPRNLQMKREGFSLNAIKFFHFTAFPASSFSSLGAQGRNAALSSKWDGGGWGGVGCVLAGGKQEGEKKWRGLGGGDRRLADILHL